MRKYWGIFRNYFATALEYRSNLMGLILMELVSMGAVLVVWLSIYSTRDSVGGFTFSEAITYYTLVPLVGFFTQAQLSNKLGNEIKDGLLSNYLLKPYHIWIMSFMRSTGEKIQSLLVVIPLYVVIVWFLMTNYNLVTLSIAGMGLALLFAFFGYILNFILDLSLSWGAFWLDDIWAIRHFKMIVFGILGGVSFPLELLPANLERVFSILPFKFFYYIPLSYVLGRRGFEEMWGDLGVLFVWASIALFLSLLLWKRGVRRYEAYGN